jgi:hypothetical protein
LLSAAVWILTLAVGAGSALAIWHLRVNESGGRRPPPAAGIAHGVIATIGLGALVLTLRGPPRGVANGAASFGTIAASLFAAALVTGIALLLLRRQPLVMAIHAAIAITGYAIVLAWASLG